MIEENLSNYKDGQAANEPDLATVIGALDDAVIFQDDSNAILFLTVDDPAAFEIGTVELKEDLTPLENAGEPLKKEIESFLERGK
ncbi:MAG TPA: hypothetical protein VHP31_09550 [Caproicibacter sp.]|nr:hypothetical protein [Caproicibacter sp.]